MILFNFLAAIFALVVNTLAVALAAPEVAARDIPTLPNFCGWFKHDDGRLGWAFANDECKNFSWKTPDDPRIESSMTKPVYTIQNEHCPLCFVWEKRDCRGALTYMGGANETEGTINPSWWMHFAPSLSYFCEPPGWHIGYSSVPIR